MSRSTAKTPQDKYVAFKTAYQTITHYLAQDNFLAAYVVAFSLIEDRVRAMFVVWHRVTKKNEPTSTQITAGFSKHVRQLHLAGDIPEEEAKLLIEEAKMRNELLHAAMWNLKAFDQAAADRAVKLSRSVDKLRRTQKKKCDK